MSFPKVILIGAVLLFAGVGLVAVAKKKKAGNAVSQQALKTLQKPNNQFVRLDPPVQKIVSAVVRPEAHSGETPSSPPLEGHADFPVIDRVHQLFTKGPSKLPIVETVSYQSSVPWLKGRPAWVADYAAHYGTSRHFIARSLSGKPDYFMQKVSTGSRFNVFRKDKRIHFHLLIDVSRCKMGFYYVDLDTNERVLIKTYPVGLGRKNASLPSGTLTPLGQYVLGSKIAVYRPGSMGQYHNKPVEMVRVFGTRWLPFEQGDQAAISAQGRGYGIHGAPWIENPGTHELAENRQSVGTYDSDGCVRLLMVDMEELFSIVITKPTFVEIVNDFREAKLPGVEVTSPRR